MNLQKLYELQNVDRTYKFSTSDPLKTAAANAIWSVEIAERFEHFKAALRALGYKRVFVGKHPTGYWRGNMVDNMIFAEPPIRIEGRVALWQGACNILGGQACGNALQDSDQAQLRLPPAAFARFVGRHEL